MLWRLRFHHASRVVGQAHSPRLWHPRRRVVARSPRHWAAGIPGLLGHRRLTIHSSLTPLRGVGLIQALGGCGLVLLGHRLVKCAVARSPSLRRAWRLMGSWASVVLRQAIGLCRGRLRPHQSNSVTRRNHSQRLRGYVASWVPGQAPIGRSAVGRPSGRVAATGGAGRSGSAGAPPNNSFKPNATSWRRLNSGVRPHGQTTGVSS